MAKLYKRLRDLMEDKGMTHQDLAHELYLSRDSVTARLRGTVPWKSYEMYIVMDLFGLSHDMLHVVFPKGGVT